MESYEIKILGTGATMIAALSCGIEAIDAAQNSEWLWYLWLAVSAAGFGVYCKRFACLKFEKA